jgi:hypothetical protein
MDDRVLIVNAVSETTRKNEAADADFVWLMADQYGLNFPQAADPKQALYNYAASTTISLPFHVAVDLRSMKIVEAGGGSITAAAIESRATQTLLGPP